MWQIIVDDILSAKREYVRTNHRLPKIRFNPIFLWRLILDFGTEVNHLRPWEPKPDTFVGMEIIEDYGIDSWQIEDNVE